MAAIPPTPPDHAHRLVLEQDLLSLRRRLVREATLAIDLLEASIRALWTLDTEAAIEVRRGEDRVDLEEVAIERECLRLLTTHRPYGTDLRFITFSLRVNSDLERIADHAASIAKICLRLSARNATPPRWPTALTELGERVPMLCHRLLRAVLDDDSTAARELVRDDAVIDTLDKRLFQEVQDYLDRHDAQRDGALYMYRVGRELERVGDLVTNIAEDVVYLATGEIIRHAHDEPADRWGEQ